MSWIEQRTVWALGWGDGRKPGLLYFLFSHPASSFRVRAARIAGDTAVVLLGLLLANPSILAGGLALLLPLLVGVIWMSLRTFHLTRRLLVSGLLRELAVTPVGAAEILRDVHLIAVRRVALAGVVWLVGHFLWMPAGPQGLFLAVLFLLLGPAAAWRLSAGVSAAAISLDCWRPSPETRRRAMVVSVLALLVLILAIVFPPAVLLTIGLKRGTGLFFILIPVALAPGLALIGGLIWELKRRRIKVDVGRMLTADAARVRQLIERHVDL